MAKLYFRYGCMGSGKSIDLLKVAFNYEERGHKVLLITAEIDNRYEVGKITSRIGISRDAYVFNDKINLYDLCLSLDYVPSCILVEESHFMNKQHIKQLSDIVDYLDIPVICYGLRSDFRNELFDGSNHLFAIADKIEEIKTICECGRKVTCNMRVLNGVPVTDGDKIMIGDLEYIEVCRKCYKEKVNNY